MLELANAEPSGDGLISEAAHRVLCSEREKGSRMTGGKRPFFHQLLNMVRERQYPEQVGYRRSVFANSFCHLLLCQLEIIEQAPIAACFFDRVQVRALEILDQCQDEHGLIVELPNDRWNLSPAEVGSGAETTLAGDQLEGIALPANCDRLQQARSLE